MSIKHIRDAARQSLHEHLAESAIHRSNGVDTPCTVRIHIADQAMDIGDLGGMSGVGNAGFGATIERAYRAIFLKAEVSPKRGDIITLNDGTVYRIEFVHPPYGITIDTDLELVA